jgi:hypothetical protein
MDSLDLERLAYGKEYATRRPFLAIKVIGSSASLSRGCSVAGAQISQMDDLPAAELLLMMTAT